MKKIVSLFLMLSQVSMASDFYFPAGASSGGLAHASVASSDFWSVINNPAATSFATAPKAGLNYESRFALKELAVKSLGFYYPNRLGTFLTSYQYFGYAIHHQMLFSLGYAKSFMGKIGASVRLNVISLYPDPEKGSLYTVSADASLYARLTDKLHAGFFIFNVPSSRFNDEAETQVPVIYRFGLKWNFIDKCALQGEIGGKNGESTMVSGGVNYALYENLNLYAGLRNLPVTVSAGLTYTRWHFDLGLSASVVRQIGKVWNCSVSYAF